MNGEVKLERDSLEVPKLVIRGNLVRGELNDWRTPDGGEWVADSCALFSFRVVIEREVERRR